MAKKPKLTLVVADDPDMEFSVQPEAESAPSEPEIPHEDGVPSYRLHIGRPDLGPEWKVPDPGQLNQINWPPKKADPQ